MAGMYDIPQHVRDWQAARQHLSDGQEAAIARLRQPSAWRRTVEALAFALLAWLGEHLIVHGWRLPGIVLVAITLNACVLLLHEGMHYVLVPDRRWNRWLSVALGALTLVSFTAYQVLHLRHHKYLGDPRDPDDYDNYRGPIWLMHYTRLITGTFLYLVAIPLKAWKVCTRDERRDILQEYALMAALYATASSIVPHDALWWCWFVPLVPVGFFTNLRGLTQHTLTDAHDPYLASRSVYPHPVVAWLLIHENLHLEHHLFPEVPSYNLKRLHDLTWPRMPRTITCRSYVEFLGDFLRASAAGDRRPIGVRQHTDPDPEGPLS